MKTYKQRPAPATLQGWVNEVEGIYRFIRALDKGTQRKERVWKTNMRVYYRQRLKYLRSVTPPEVSCIRGGRVVLRRRTSVT